MDRARRPPAAPQPAPHKRAADSHRAKQTSQQAVLDHVKQLKITSRQLTVCLICLVAASSCLSPYLTLHLNQSLALQLLELDVVQLRSSVFSVIISVLFLVSTVLLLRLIGTLRPQQNIHKPQRQLKNLLALTAIISAISYLSLALVVPRIKQVTRMPLASFDCNANLITIENCHQQFSTSNGEQSLWEALHYLLIKDLSRSDDERLIKKLNCLQYKDGPHSKEPTRRSLVGTRFLLHDCGLVCKPQRQYLRQFGDDLNADPAEAFQGSTVESDLFSSQQQVSLKVCFSGESGGSPSSYKQFCITNLASRAQRDLANAQTLTVGQLNEMLRKLVATNSNSQQPPPDPPEQSGRSSATQKRADEPVEQQGTHYVNPIVQFESHFKNWPHLNQPSAAESTSDSANSSETNGSGAGSGGLWCKFRPIPPFIVNNKPFDEIQCSLEHEYTMSMAGTSHSFNIPRDQQIFLKRSGRNGAASDETVRKAAQERCSIQCRLNIFYQVDTRQNNNNDNNNNYEDISLLKHYYLPMKPCLIVSKEANKSATIDYYTLFRSIADASLTLSIIFLALLLLLESMDAKQAPQDSKKHRIVGLLSALAIMPLVVGSMFELSSLYLGPKGGGQQYQVQGHLFSWFQDKLLPGVVEFLTQVGLSKKPILPRASGTEPPNLSSPPADDDVDLITTASKHTQPLVDSYTTPFFLYSILMFTMAIVSLSLPSVQSPGSLLRLSSAESLGLSSVSNWNKLKSQHQKHNINTNTKNLKKELPYSPAISLFLAALFMGYQFNLCHIGETQIMLETFGGPNVNRWSQPQSSSSSSFSSSPSAYHQNLFTAVWFALSVSSASNLTLLLLALVFSTELSAFFSQFSLFKLTPTQTAEDRQKSNANLIMYLAISLLVYSVRSYILSGITPSFSLKLFIVLMLQAVTTFNLPAIWLALSTRLHEMIAWRSSEAGKLTLNIHLLGEASLGLVYFALGRLLALFIHTINTSLHLHSDDVDWFINTFYRNTAASAATQPSEGTGSNNTNSNEFASSSQPEVSRLFSPLPSERQTYLHASRIFLRYNSLVCLLCGSVLVATFLHLRYHIWAEQRRTLEVSRWASLGVEQASSSLERDSCIDERLSSDLLRIHSSTTRASSGPAAEQIQIRSPKHSSARQEVRRPRARILYRYSVNREDQSSESGHEKSSSLDDSAAPHNVAPNVAAPPPSEFRIPIAVSEESEVSDVEPPDLDNPWKEEEPPIKTAPPPEEVLERKIVRVRKMVQLVEERGEHSHDQTSRRAPSATRKRSISFAPTATLIGDYPPNGVGVSSRRSQANWHSLESVANNRPQTSSTRGPKCASPEPSIDGDEQEQYDSRHRDVDDGAHNHQ